MEQAALCPGAMEEAMQLEEQREEGERRVAAKERQARGRQGCVRLCSSLACWVCLCEQILFPNVWQAEGLREHFVWGFGNTISDPPPRGGDFFSQWLACPPWVGAVC